LVAVSVVDSFLLQEDPSSTSEAMNTSERDSANPFLLCARIEGSSR
jgi:hypothetical protein